MKTYVTVSESIRQNDAGVFEAVTTVTAGSIFSKELLVVPLDPMKALESIHAAMNHTPVAK